MCSMTNYIAIEFILGSPEMVQQALDDILMIVQSSRCMQPASYHGWEADSLVLVWRYTQHRNQQAWDVCHHIPHMLFYEHHRAFVNFCNKYRTAPVVFSSEECCRMLRFGNPQAFTYLGGIPWDASDLSLLCDGDFHPQTFMASVEALLAKNIDAIRSFQDSEIGKRDFNMLYLLYKKLEAMAITTDSTARVQPYLNFLHEHLSR